jgi:uncharacterized sporulation protein YeaH/YhbH (DUF444 family)
VSMIIDRRLNDHNKSATNRERFIRRYKDQLKRAIDSMVADRSIRDMEQGGDVRIPVKDISEPSFRHGQGGDREMVHPGNRTFSQGDRIARPESGAGRGGQGGSGQGDGSDSFEFSLSREEFMKLFFDDLELPNLARTVTGTVAEKKLQRAGYTRYGASTNLSVVRSLRNALARRIALRAGVRRQFHEAKAELASLSLEKDSNRVDHLLGLEISEYQRRMARVPFLDEIDLRYRHRITVPQPITQAVMFCLMDVSASMDEQKKDLAKRFYTLLYLFLSRKYAKVDVVFVRHTENAEEVDEDRFFHDPQTGGTVVYSALELMHEIVTARYPSSSWNIYGAQVSDGDAFGADPEKSRGFLETQLLPLTRYYAYIEVPDLLTPLSTLASSYKRITAEHFAMREVRERREIYPVLRDLFKRESQ